MNDLSIHGQFGDLSAFREALVRIIAIRTIAKKYGHELHCHGSFSSAVATPNGMLLRQAAPRMLSKDEQRALMQWIDRSGPFWNVEREHGENDYFECNDEIVTDSAIGEAAYRSIYGSRCDLVSATPSEWDFSPVNVTWRRESEGLYDQIASLENWRDPSSLEDKLRDIPPPLQSWDDLKKISESRFTNLSFTPDCFKPLAGLPFAASTALSCTQLLDILEQLARAFDQEGKRTPEGHAIYQKHFTGQNALFSDSSETEKNDFANALHFPHPEYRGESLFCPWHGKERHMKFRLHFSWPIRYEEPVYVVYIGPKITKR